MDIHFVYGWRLQFYLGNRFQQFTKNPAYFVVLPTNKTKKMPFHQYETTSVTEKDLTTN